MAKEKRDNLLFTVNRQYLECTYLILVEFVSMLSHSSAKAQASLWAPIVTVSTHSGVQGFGVWG